MLTRVPSGLLWLLVGILSVWVLVRGVVPALENPGGDFANYYTASRLLLEGESLERAYWDFSWFQKQIDGSGIPNQMGGFIPHPPSTGLVLLPLAALDPLPAKILWTLLNVALGVAGAFLLARLAGLPSSTAGLILLLSGPALINNFLFGQLYLFLLVSVLAGLVLQQGGRPTASGICFGLLAPVKYLGFVWLAYFAWKRQWRLVCAGVATALLVVLVTLFADGLQVFLTFASEVVPRYLSGEVQDPFTVRLQTWNSLLRRLFLFEPTLNPQPLIHAPLLFFLGKNAIFWGIFLFSMRLLGRSGRTDCAEARLFQIGLIPVAVLLLAPVGATYHFLLLTLSTGCFTAILLARGQPARALVLAALFFGLHLPHYLWLEARLQGPISVLAYSRLGLLLGYFLLAVRMVGPPGSFRPVGPWIAGTLLLSLTLGTWQVGSHLAAARDGATWLPVKSPEFDRNLGLLIDSPDIGDRELVFSYGELFENRYSIFTAKGIRWTEPTDLNLYEPDLFRDDEALLAETVDSGPDPRSWIVAVTRRGTTPRRITPGSRPSWEPDGHGFAFLSRGTPALYEAEVQRLPGASHNCLDLAYSPLGRSLAYTTRSETGYDLRLYLLNEGREEILLSSEFRIQDVSWSPDAGQILFSWSLRGNTDIWLLNRADGGMTRLTRHPANDKNPVWDPRSRRILFISDRGRGLQFGALYWLPLPHSLKP